MGTKVTSLTLTKYSSTLQLEIKAQGCVSANQRDYLSFEAYGFTPKESHYWSINVSDKINIYYFGRVS